MYKIAVLGDKDSIYGFSALGLDIYPVALSDDTTEAVKKLRDLAEGDYAVIYIIESLAEKIKSEINRYSSTKLPAIILIPGASANNGLGMKMVKKSVERAVGSDILFRD